MSSKMVPHSIKMSVLFRDNWKCRYCGITVHLTKSPNATMDHVKPVSRGGKSTLSNLVTSCGLCNSKKGAS